MESTNRQEKQSLAPSKKMIDINQQSSLIHLSQDLEIYLEVDFIALSKLTGLATNAFPLMAIPIAGYLSFLGIKISKDVKTKDL